MRNVYKLKKLKVNLRGKRLMFCVILCPFKITNLNQSGTEMMKYKQSQVRSQNLLTSDQNITDVKESWEGIHNLMSQTAKEHFPKKLWTVKSILVMGSISPSHLSSVTLCLWSVTLFRQRRQILRWHGLWCSSWHPEQAAWRFWLGISDEALSHQLQSEHEHSAGAGDGPLQQPALHHPSFLCWHSEGHKGTRGVGYFNVAFLLITPCPNMRCVNPNPCRIHGSSSLKLLNPDHILCKAYYLDDYNYDIWPNAL